MTVIDDFSDNDKSINNYNSPLDEAGMERYIAEFGADRAIGYLQALTDVTKELAEILQRKSPGSCRRETPHMVRTNLNLYVTHKQDLVENLKLHFKELPSSDKPFLG